MWRRRFTNFLWILLVVLAVGIQLWDEKRRDTAPAPPPSPSAKPPPRSSPARAKQERPRAASGYEVLTGCALVENRNNDGDSFKIRRDGGVHEFRLYFVDAPEKRLHQHNGERLDHQGRYFGGLSRNRTIAIGQQAKELAGELMSARPFRVETRWQPVFDSGRFYAFVFFDDDGDELSEKLVRAGLARIYTEGADLPDGRKKADFERHLKKLEAEAKKNKRGAWRR